MSLSLCVRLRRVVGWSVLGVLAFAWSPSLVFAQAPNALFSDERTGPADAALAARPGAANPMVRRSRTTTINLQMLNAPAPTAGATGFAAAPAPSAARSVDLNLFSDVNLVALFDHVESVPAANGSAWVGMVSGVEGSEVILAVADGVLAGVINLPGHTYSVRRAVDGTYDVIEINRNAILHGGDDAVTAPVGAPAAAVTREVAPADSGDTFDLLLYYTTAVKNAVGGTAAANALVTSTIAETNAIYLSSGIGARLRLVGAIELNYKEVGDDLSADLNAITASATAQADRNRLGADLVTLVVNPTTDITRNSFVAGLAWTMTAGNFNNPNSESLGFSTLLYISPLSYITSLAHELGHNMGCLHEPGNNRNNGAFSYSQGYTDVAHKFYDVMSYGNECTDPACIQLNQFSSPTNTYQGFATGTATQDNVRTINNTRTFVANYRQAVRAVLGAPSNFSASSSGSSISLAWTAGSGQPTGYVLEAGTASGKTDITTVNLASTATAFAADGIAGGLYYLRVYATDGVTKSQTSNEAVLQVGACSSAPPAPAKANIAVAGSTIVLSWVPAARATNYILEAGSSSGSSNLAIVDITSGANAVAGAGGALAGGVPNQLAWSYSPLGAGSYFLRVKAKNACGTSSASNEVVATVR